MMDYSQMELRILRQMLHEERWSGWWKQGWNLDFAPGSLRTCSFIAFALGYGCLENTVVLSKSDDFSKHRQRALDAVADSQASTVVMDSLTAKVSRKAGRTNAMAINFARLYGGVGIGHG